VGINDTWRRYGSGAVTPVPGFEVRYRELLEAARAAGVRHRGAAALAADGVHATAEGHRALADLWWATVSGADLAD
jgi:lysophospholipase L1-like esterase